MKTTNDNFIGSRWKELNNHHQKELDKNGYKYFRENIAKHYMTDNKGQKGDHVVTNDEEGIEALYQYITEKCKIDVDISDTQLGGGVYMQDDKDNIITMDLLLSLLEIDRMQKAVDFDKIKTVTEIGAGYGRTLHAILKKYPHIECNIIDIEPALSVSKHYLKEVLPEANIKWYTPDSDKLPDTDIVFSISAFCEMPNNIIDIYFNYINKQSKYLYFKHDRQCGHFPDRNNITDMPVRSEWTQIFSQNCPVTPRFYEELYIIK